MNFPYGNSWEKFPIEEGQIWKLENGSKIAVHDIFNPIPSWMHADLVFTDLPYTTGQIKSYYSKAELLPPNPYCLEIEKFISVVFDRINFIGAKTVYIEIGSENIDIVELFMKEIYPCVQRWPVLYYRKHPTNIIRGGLSPPPLDLKGIDEAKCISMIAEAENYHTIADPCMGRGLVGVAAYKSGHPFLGTELNKRRLACLIEKIDKLGGKFSKS